MNDNLISRSALKKSLNFVYDCDYIGSTSKEGIASDIIETIDNAPTVEQECYITGAQWNEFMKEHKRPDAIKFNKIKAIIDNWAVDDDEHELLEQISDILDETEEENE